MAKAGESVDGFQAIFWVSAAGLGWILLGYPAALTLARERPWRRDPSLVPSVSIVIPAYRELEELPLKLRALAELDYDPERLDVVVTLDGDERLVAAAQQAAPGATVLYAGDRTGKAVAVNRGVSQARGQVLLLTDANNLLAPDSLKAAVEHFADPAVWAVAGQRQEAGSAYDRYEDTLRRLESRSGSVAAVSGDFIAVRAERMPELPAGAVNEDLWLLCELVRRGGRVVYEPRCSSREPPLAVGSELTRRTRIAAGRAMLIGELRGLPPGFALRVVSHKHGRLALPFLLAAALVSCAALARRRPYGVLLSVQGAFYLLAAGAAVGVAPSGPAGVPARAARQFLIGNVATALGVLRALRRRQGVRWEPVR